MVKRSSVRMLIPVLWALVFVSLASYTTLVALPAAQSNVGFAVYYTAASMLVYEPATMPQVYNNDWFAAQLGRIAAPGVYDIFNAHPPTMSLLLLPLVGLGPGAARFAWTLLGLPFLVGGFVLLARALDLPARWGLWAVPAGLLFAPITENVRSGQAYLLLFFLLCVIFWALARPAVAGVRSGAECAGRRGEPVAGLALGLMLALKSAGAWIGLLLLAARRWRALMWAVALGSMLALASLPLVGVTTWLAYFAVLPGLASDPKRYVTAYQTVTSMFGRLLVYDAGWSPSPALHAPALASALTLIVTLTTLALSARWARLDDRSHAVRALSVALFAVLGVTNGPFAEGYHYVLVLPSLLVAIWWAWRAQAGWKPWVTLVLAALLIGAPLPYRSARLQSGWLVLLAYPRVYGAYLLWAWIGRALTREPHPRRCAAPPLSCGEGDGSQV